LTKFSCYRPPGLVPAVELPTEVWCRLVEYAAGWAIEHDDAIVLLGAAPGEAGFWAGAYCCAHCKFEHSGATAVLPDLIVAELSANANPAPDTQVLRRADGRSASLYCLTERTDPRG
jgi:hypothetical protein